MAFTCILMCGLIAFLHIFSIPNPEAVSLTALGLVCGVLGYQSGIVCAVLQVMYLFYFYSEGHTLISFTSENLLKVVVSLICVAVNIAVIEELRENWEFSRKKLTGANRNLREMFHRADEMLYESKRKGKNCFTGNIGIKAGTENKAM